MIDPLAQFKIHTLFSIIVSGWDISFTNSSLFMALTTLAIIVLFAFGSIKKIVPGRLQVLCEMLYEFVASLVKENLGTQGIHYLPYILSIFLFVLMGNLLGMIPGGFTFTSHIIVTFSLALIIFIAITIIGIVKHGAGFLRLFIPKNIPLFIAPLLIPVEIISYLSRPISLSVRLFANMVAGHAMLKIFAGFVALIAGSTFFPLAILPLVVSIAITGFEFLVALLQAYVFTILTCIYLNDALNLH